VWVQFLNWTPAFITSADICCFFFLLLLIIKYSETDAVKHNRQQRFKAGTVSKDVFLFYCVQEHVESEPLKSWQIIYLLNSCMELSWSILWRHNMCTRSLMCTWIWIKIFICAPFIILIQIRQTIYFLVLHHVDQDDAHKRLSWSRSRSYLLLQSYLAHIRFILHVKVFYAHGSRSPSWRVIILIHIMRKSYYLGADVFFFTEDQYLLLTWYESR